jgi:hypothetical protein
VCTICDENVFRFQEVSVGTLLQLTTTLRRTSAGLPSTSRTRRANA